MSPLTGFISDHVSPRVASGIIAASNGAIQVGAVLTLDSFNKALATVIALLSITHLIFVLRKDSKK